MTPGDLFKEVSAYGTIHYHLFLKVRVPYSGSAVGYFDNHEYHFLCLNNMTIAFYNNWYVQRYMRKIAVAPTQQHATLNFEANK